MRRTAAVRSEISETRPALDIHLFCLPRGRCFGTIECFQITSVTEMSDYDELHDWGLVLIVGQERLLS